MTGSRQFIREIEPNAACLWCQGAIKKGYRLNERHVGKCSACGSGTTLPMPTERALHQFYSGFLFQANNRHKKRIEGAVRKIAAHAGLPETPNILDVGGGGGLFARAFEEVLGARSTYVDLDDKACHYARGLGLEKVIQCNALELGKRNPQKFDLIYARHLAEHLIRPDLFILEMSKLLKETGTLLIHVPNGGSYEYFLYPELLKNKIAAVRRSNPGIGRGALLYHLLLKGFYLHGIDPVRHLHSMTRKGLQAFAARHALEVTFRFAGISDAVYSPHYDAKRRDLPKKILGRIMGPSHMMAFMGQKKN